MDTLALLRAASTATLTSVLREHGLRNTFMHGVAPLRPDCRVAGPALPPKRRHPPRLPRFAPLTRFSADSHQMYIVLVS